MKLSPQATEKLKQIVGNSHVLTDELSLSLYSYDCSLSRTRPDGVVLVQNTAQIADIIRVLSDYHIPFVPRASATNHAGSCIALKGGIILNLTQLNHILKINTQEGFAIVEPGVITADLQDALAPLGYFYAPDPASTRACTLGGNLAQNASGARCMKYGGTLDHVLAADFVMSNGTQIHLSRTDSGPDLIGLIAGSEGTLGVLTQLTVKILPVAKHIQTFLVTFPSLQSSVQTVSDLCAHGIIPRCVEAMDQTTTRAVEEFAHAGYPVNAEALLILELDGTPAQIKKQQSILTQICLAHNAQKFIAAKTDEERENLWRGRRSAYAAMARLSPNVMVGDGTVPRSELPATLERVQQIITQNNLRASLLFHAGDGNFHPHILFDQRNKLQTMHATQALNQILKTCVDSQGTLSGEHGVGVEKRAVMSYQYDESTLKAMQKIKHALDPKNIANPLKILPCQFQEKSRQTSPFPAEIAILQKQLKTWNKTDTAFEILGSNSKLKTTTKTVLSSKVLSQIIEIDTANYTVTAQAGIKLSDLATALKKAGVHSILPTEKGTLGGVFASGILPEFYSQVTGLEALLKDGSYVRYGGKLTKNAAGYPLIHLLAGSRGTLGLVTQLTFKVFAQAQKIPKPRTFTPAQGNELWARLICAFTEGIHA
ncbi:MAG: FAD-binding protein [Elusimicrobiaceae bacterium]|nr:FAD-binding protein [Elusimicrobiaceae bacterium]